MKKEKYIYFVKDNVYRIKIIKKKPEINYDKYFKCYFEEAIRIRNEILKDNNIILKKKVNTNENVLIEKYIYQTVNNKYRLFIRSGNYYYSKTIERLSEARKQREIKMSEKMLINSREGRNNATINDFVNVWFSIYCFKELKTTTSSSMMNTLNKYVLEELGNEKISKITTFKLQKYFSDLKSKYTNISDKTIYRIYKVMKNMFNRAMQWGYIFNNPIDKVKIRRPKSKETEIYSYEELIQILSLLKKENIVFNTIFSLIITTGIRKCELLGYLAYRERIVNKGVSSLFINKKGGIIGFSYLEYNWEKFIKKNNLKHVTIHGLRHSYCSMQMKKE